MHLLEWLKSKILTSNADKDVEHQKFSCSFLVKIQNDTVPVQDSLAISYKTKHTFTI